MAARVRPSDNLEQVLRKVRRCTLCDGLPLGPKPALQASASARILIAAQAPGRRAHERGRPFDDPSGERLRNWLAVGRDAFYDPALFAIIPIFAPFALLFGILAVRDIQKSKDQPHLKHGMGRAIFGIIMGLLGTIALIVILIMMLMD